MHLAKLNGHDKQHSGQPATLFGNSMVSLMLMARTVDNIKDAIVLVKGDDTLIIGKDIEFNDYLSTQDDKLKLKIKAVQGKPPQFVNNFITPDGIVPDPVRLAAKVKSKTFRNMDLKFNDTKQLRHVTRPVTALITLDYAKIRENDFEHLEQVMERNCNSNVLYVVNATPTPHYYRAMHFIAMSYNVRIISHVTHKQYEQMFSEFVESVKDRTNKVKTLEQYTQMIQSAALYYAIDEKEVELCWNWLKSCTVEHMQNNTEVLSLAHTQFENETDTETKFIDVHMDTMDLGGNGDCFWRALKYQVQQGKMSQNNYDTIYNQFPEQMRDWVEMLQAIDICSQNKIALSILVSYNGVYTVYGNCNTQPIIKLTFHNADPQSTKEQRGHYTALLGTGKKETCGFTPISTIEFTGGANETGHSHEDIHHTDGGVKVVEHGDSTSTGQKPLQGNVVRNRRTILQQLSDYKRDLQLPTTGESISGSIDDCSVGNAGSVEHNTEDGNGNRQPSDVCREVWSQTPVFNEGLEIFLTATFTATDLLDWIWRRYRCKHPATSSINFMCGCHWSRSQSRELWSGLCDDHRTLVKSWSTESRKTFTRNVDTAGWLCGWNLVQAYEATIVRPNLEDDKSDWQVPSHRERKSSIPNVRSNQTGRWGQDPIITNSNRDQLPNGRYHPETERERNQHCVRSTSLGTEGRQMGRRTTASTTGSNRVPTRSTPRPVDRDAEPGVRGREQQRKSEEVDDGNRATTNDRQNTETTGRRDSGEWKRKILKGRQPFSIPDTYKSHHNDRRQTDNGGQNRETTTEQRVPQRSRKQHDSFCIRDNITIHYGRVNLRRTDGVIAHCIGQDATFGAGFAKQIRTIAGDEAIEKIAESIREYKLNMGRLINMKLDETNTTIVNMITKPYSKQPPKSITVLNECLRRLNNLEYDEIDMPLIGCGRDKLDPNDVLTSITQNVSCKINIYVDNINNFNNIKTQWKPMQ